VEEINEDEKNDSDEEDSDKEKDDDDDDDDDVSSRHNIMYLIYTYMNVYLGYIKTCT
jgi:hypothetical protein